MSYRTGFEVGLATPVSSGGGLFSAVGGSGLSIQSTYKKSGSYALRVTSSASTVYARSPSWAGVSSYTAKFEFMVHSWPGSSTLPILKFWHSGVEDVYFGVNPSTYKVRWQTWGAESSSTIELDTWYTIDCKIDISTTLWKLWWKFEGSDQTYVEVTKGGATVCTAIQFGHDAAATHDSVFDDVIFSTDVADYPIGGSNEVAVEGLRPDSDGSHNLGGVITDEDGGTTNLYSKLDENPWITTASDDLVRQTANNTSAYCEVGFANTTYANIEGVQAVLQYAANSATATLAACYIIYANGTLAATVWGNNTTGNDYSETSAYYKSTQVTAPAGGWTTNEVNGLKARLGHGANAGSVNPYWLGLILEVAGNGTAGGFNAENYMRLRLVR